MNTVKVKDTRERDCTVNRQAIACVTWDANWQNFGYGEPTVGAFEVTFMGGSVIYVQSNPLDDTDTRGPVPA